MKFHSIADFGKTNKQASNQKGLDDRGSEAIQLSRYVRQGGFGVCEMCFRSSYRYSRPKKKEKEKGKERL